MKKRLLSFLLALVAVFSLTTSALADVNETNAGEKIARIPITLTVVHSIKNVDVTLPASMPVSVLDGKVLTADNLRIVNHSKSYGVRVTTISVEDSAYTVANYENFPETRSKQIALSINGCETEEAGMLFITEEAFPVIASNSSLPIRYQAKVSASQDVSGINAANVIFTLKAV